MFFRVKKSQNREYLQIVENRREDGKVKQRVLATLGRIEQLQGSGQLDALLQSGAHFAEAVLLVSAHARGELPAICSRRIGAVKVFERLWRESGCQGVINELLAHRQFELPVERAIFLTVLHRLLSSGSDRAAERWREDYAIAGVEKLELHHLYRAMAWLGEPLSDQQGATPFSPRCTKDRIEEALFARHRDLFSELELVFFDTTSIYFEGEGGETVGQRGYSKDHRPELKQLVVGAVLDEHGRPVACKLWSGNTTTHQHRTICRRGGTEVQAVMASRGHVSHHQVATGDASDLPPARRDHPRPCLLLLFRTHPAQGIARSPRGHRACVRMGRRAQRPGSAPGNRGRAPRQALSFAHRGQRHLRFRLPRRGRCTTANRSTDPGGPSGSLIRRSNTTQP
jgi:hypothetical protein